LRHPFVVPILINVLCGIECVSYACDEKTGGWKAESHTCTKTSFGAQADSRSFTSNRLESKQSLLPTATLGSSAQELFSLGRAGGPQGVAVLRLNDLQIGQMQLAQPGLL
jgi:hypothetical protein